MRLHRNPDTGYWTDLIPGVLSLTNIHGAAVCESQGCAIHNHPSDHPLKDAPLNWSTDRGIWERICEHVVFHPDWDAAVLFESQGAGFMNVHGCDGCCGLGKEEPPTA